MLGPKPRNAWTWIGLHPLSMTQRTKNGVMNVLFMLCFVFKHLESQLRVLCNSPLNLWSYCYPLEQHQNWNLYLADSKTWCYKIKSILARLWNSIKASPLFGCLPSFQNGIKLTPCDLPDSARCIRGPLHDKGPAVEQHFDGLGWKMEETLQWTHGKGGQTSQGKPLYWKLESWHVFYRHLNTNIYFIYIYIYFQPNKTLFIWYEDEWLHHLHCTKCSPSSLCRSHSLTAWLLQATPIPPSWFP